MAAKSTKDKQLAKRKARIMVLSHSSEFLGGGERSMIDLFEYWSNKGYVEPHFIIREPLKGLEKEISKRGWNYSAIHYTNWSQRNPRLRPEDIFRNARENAKAVAKIEQLIEKLQPDIVATNTLVAPWAALAAHFQRVPHLWFIREYGDLDHKHTFELGREKTLQDIDSLSFLVAANSQTLTGHLRDYIDNSKIATVYTPFDLELLDKKIDTPSKSPFSSKDSLKIVITGTIAASKGQHLVVEVAGKLNKQGHDTEVCIIGRPAEKDGLDRIQQLIQQYDIAKKIHLIGQQDNPLSFAKHADVGVMASQREAFGRVTFEYMYTGLAVVGANSGATPELITDGASGLLYTGGDIQSLKKQLLRYVKDKKMATQHGTAARKKATAMMTGEHSAEHLYARIKSEISQRKPLSAPSLHFSRRWLDYPLVAQDYIDDSKVISLQRIVYGRMRGYAKSVYLKAIGFIRKEHA